MPSLQASGMADPLVPSLVGVKGYLRMGLWTKVVCAFKAIVLRQSAAPSAQHQAISMFLIVS